MGQKVHPVGFRLGITKTWSAQWYADKDYTKLLQEDLRIRKLIDVKLAAASISKVEIERGLNYVTVTVHSAKPGVVIGKGGANVEVLRAAIGEISAGKVKLEIPVIAAGIDALPAEAKNGLGQALSTVGSAYLTREPLPHSKAPWLQLLEPGDTPNPGAVGHVYVQPKGFHAFKIVG